MSASRGLGIERGAAAGLIGGVVSGVLLQLTHMITPAGVPASAMRLCTSPSCRRRGSRT